MPPAPGSAPARLPSQARREVTSQPMLGIDLGGTKTEAALLDASGAVVWRERVPTPTADYEASLLMLRRLAERGRAAAGTVGTTGTASGAVSIGVGTPGTITADGRMKNCNTQCLNGRYLQRDLAAALGQPVAMANDANCLALSEATDGAGAGAAVVFAAILGTGVGAGIAVHGRVLSGPNGVAGEWGHNPLPWLDSATGGAPADPSDRNIHRNANGTSETRAEPLFIPHCYCGQRGCVETLVSGPGLAQDHAQRTGQQLTAEHIAQAAAAGDAACQHTLRLHASRLARALAAVINVLDPDVIVLGGGLSLMPHLYTEVPALWGQWVVSGGVREPVRTRLLPSVHGDASGVRGAAWLGASKRLTG
jgi:fructokinase